MSRDCSLASDLVKAANIAVSVIAIFFVQGLCARSVVKARCL